MAQIINNILKYIRNEITLLKLLVLQQSFNHYKIQSIKNNYLNFNLYKKSFYQFHHFNYFNQNSLNIKNNFLLFLLFNFFNKSEYILKNDYFFIFIAQKRMQINIKNTFFYKKNIKINGQLDKKPMYENFLVGFRSM